MKSKNTPNIPAFQKFRAINISCLPIFPGPGELLRSCTAPTYFTSTIHGISSYTMSYLENARNLHLPDNEDASYQLLAEFLALLPRPCLELDSVAHVVSQLDLGKHKDIVNLCLLELWMYFPQEGPRRDMVDPLVRALSHLSPTSLGNDEKHTLALIKYYDLVSDYQYLFGNVSILKLTELITKKLTVLSSAQALSFVVDSIHVKVAMYYLLCGTDHRKKVVQRYLEEKQVFGLFPLELVQLLEPLMGTALTPYAEFRRYLEYLKTTQYPMATVVTQHEQVLVRKFLDCKMLKLPRYYLSISFDRIQRLLTNDEIELDTEDFVYEIVMAHKLPEGTRVDQVDKMVYFGDDTKKHDPINLRAKTICDLVNSL